MSAPRGRLRPCRFSWRAAAGLVGRLRELASNRTVVLLDYTTNGDVTDLSAPLAHAALIAQHIEVPA